MSNHYNKIHQYAFTSIFSEPPKCIPVNVSSYSVVPVVAFERSDVTNHSVILKIVVKHTSSKHINRHADLQVVSGLLIDM